MKKLRLIFSLLIIALCSLFTAKAQVGISVSIGTPPSWGPAGYSEARYYYLPDVEAYYDVHTSMFIYHENRGWVRRAYLPRRYRDYDLYSGYKVVMNDYHGDAPYTYYNEHRVKYAKGYHGKEQRNIGERPGRGNSHDRMESKGHYDKREIRRNDRNVKHGNDKGNSRGNQKEQKGNNGHGEGKGKNK